MQDHSHMSNFSYLDPIGRNNASQPKTRDAETEIADFPMIMMSPVPMGGAAVPIMSFNGINPTRLAPGGNG